MPSKNKEVLKALKANELNSKIFESKVYTEDINNTFSFIAKSGKANSENQHRVMDALDNYISPSTDGIGMGTKEAKNVVEKAARDLVEMDKEFGLVKSSKFNVNTPVDKIQTASK